MKCRLPDCPGEYEERRLVEAFRYQGRVIVIDNVPADVCDFYGDTLLKPATSAMIERMTRTPSEPAEFAPFYHYPDAGESSVYPSEQPNEVAERPFADARKS